MAPAWEIMSDTVAGTLRMREKRELYLPKEPGEKPEHYAYRLARATFFNAVDRTLNGLTGMVFRNEPKLGENVPEFIRGRESAGDEATPRVEGQWENIDNAGTHGAVFCKELFSDAMRDGHAAIFVDYPPPLEESADASQIPNQADENRAGRRPNWVSYCADKIINWRTEIVNGKKRLALIVFKEETYESDGEYGEEKVIRYRVLRPGKWELYREISSAGAKREIKFEKGGPTSLAEIPVAIVYSRKTGWLTSQPPLLDLALLNISHYQKYNDFSIYIHLCRPILCRKPAAPAKPVTDLSAYAVMETSDNGNIWYAEPTGAGLKPSSEDLKDIEQRMSILGLSLLVKQTSGPITATEEKNDQLEESSDLATAARSLQDAIEQALKFHAQYLNSSAETGGNVELGAALDDLILAPQEVQAYSAMVGANQITLETLWKILAAAGRLPADFDPKKERAQIEKDMDAATERMAKTLDRAPAPDEQ